MGIVTVVKNVCKNKPFCKDFAIGDVAFVLSGVNIRYPMLCLDIVSCQTDTDRETYIYRLYYIDRTLPTASSRFDIQLEACQFLAEVVRDVSDYIPIIAPLSIYPFVQNFADECAGGYVDISVPTTNHV